MAGQVKRPVVKQYGLRRSGTNLARALLLANYRVKVLVNKGGHKHDRHHPANFEEHPDLLVTVKHPLHWLYSVWCYWDKKWEREHKPRVPWKDYATPENMGRWSALNRHWATVNIGKARRVVVRCEDLVERQAEACMKIADALGLEPRVEYFEHVTRRLTTNGHDSGFRFEWRDWRSAYTPQLRDRLWEAVDGTLSEKWGYGKDG